MGGDHHHGPKIPKIPDWRIYKVDDIPELVRTKNALAALGLRDPWLRNEVWRFDPKLFGTRKQKVQAFFLRGFKWGLLGAVTLYGIERALGGGEHGHGHEGHH